jgi:hypothetical protein
MRWREDLAPSEVHHLAGGAACDAGNPGLLRHGARCFRIKLAAWQGMSPSPDATKPAARCVAAGPGCCDWRLAYAVVPVRTSTCSPALSLRSIAAITLAGLGDTYGTRLIAAASSARRRAGRDYNLSTPLLASTAALSSASALSSNSLAAARSEVLSAPSVSASASRRAAASSPTAPNRPRCIPVRARRPMLAPAAVKTKPKRASLSQPLSIASVSA